MQQKTWQPGRKNSPEAGMALVAVIMVLMVATLVAVGISTNTTIDLKITSNKRALTQDFFICEGANQFEVPKIATDPNLKVPDITHARDLKDADTKLENVDEEPAYHAKIKYNFYRQALKAGYSLGMFNAYYYSTETKRNRNGIKTTESKIGPKI